MPLVFLHGVNTRKGPDYDNAVAARDALFRRFALAKLMPGAVPVAVANPYWGDLGARAAWGNASIPQGEIEAFGSAGELPDLLLADLAGARMPARDKVILTVARNSFAAAIDLLWGAAPGLEGSKPNRAAAWAELAETAIRYAERDPHPAWLEEVNSDTAFLQRLQDELEDWVSPGSGAESAPEQFGMQEGWERIKEAAGRLGSAAGRLTSGVLVDATRFGLHQQVSLFFGDVFVYLQERGTPEQPGRIVQRIRDALLEARQQVNATDSKLIVVAHSLGGVILYDILTSFMPKVQKDFRLDVLVTVGSQVALFEELKLYGVSRKDFPHDPQTDRVPKPASIHYWLNVFDTNDVLSFATERVFADTVDFSYSTGKGLLAAHGAYFGLPSFHERLAARLAGLFGGA